MILPEHLQTEPVTVEAVVVSIEEKIAEIRAGVAGPEYTFVVNTADSPQTDTDGKRSESTNERYNDMVKRYGRDAVGVFNRAFDASNDEPMHAMPGWTAFYLKEGSSRRAVWAGSRIVRLLSKKH